MCLNKKLQSTSSGQHTVGQLVVTKGSVLPGRKDSRSSILVQTRGCQKPRLNQLWSIWYCSCTLAFEIFLIVRTIQRFLKYIALPWPTQDQPYLELNAYVGFVGAAVVMLPFFVVSSLLRVGNYPNDGCKIGLDRSGTGLGSSCIYQNLKGRPKFLKVLRTMWRHGGPTAPLLHTACAFCLLLPNVLIQAQLIKHGFLPRGEVWRTDLDFLLPHRDRLIALNFLAPPGLNRSDVLLSRELQDRQPRDLVRDSTPLLAQEHDQTVSLEFINMVLALTVHAVRYPAVFWHAHKGFAFVFSLQLGLDAAQKVLAFAGFAVLYKVHVVGAEETLVSQASPLLLNIALSLLLFFLYNAVLTLTGSSLYLYGLQKYREWMQRRMRRSHVTWLEDKRRLWGYMPQLSALLVLLMAIITAGPLMYDYTLVYCGSLDGAMLAGVTGTVTHLFLWILLWLFLTVKTRWSFVRGARIHSDYHTVHPPPVALQASLGTSSSAGQPKKGQDAPLLVIDNGQTYQVRETNSKQAILGLAQKDQQTPAKKQETPDGNDEDIYWLKPKVAASKDKETTSAAGNGGVGDRMTWLKRKSPGPSRHKVTFEDKTSTVMSGASGSPCKRTRAKSPKTSSGAAAQKGTLMRRKHSKGEHSDSASDDGDYATLREMVLARDETDDEGLDSKKPLFKNGIPVGHRRLMSDDGDYELLVEESRLPPPQMVSAVVHTGEPPIIFEPVGGGLTPKFDTASESSSSPVKGGSESSSSGCHSLQCSVDTKRSSSVENLIPRAGNLPWKSLSLQRNTPAPGETYIQSGYVSVPRTFKEDVYYDPRESTLVIRRKREGRGDGSDDTPFGRATNMRMTSFTDQPDFPNGNVPPGKTATSPKYNDVANRNACMVLPNGTHSTVYSKPIQVQQTAASYATHQRRDSANYSLNSSGESDTYMSHT